jgi:hypothetical protein
MANASSPNHERLGRSAEAPVSDPSFALRRLKITDRSGETFDVNELWATLRGNSRLILGFAFLVVVLFLVATLTSRMAFRIAGSLYLGEVQAKASTAGGSDALDFLGNPQGELGTEIEILKSESPSSIKRSLSWARPERSFLATFTNRKPTK